MKGQVCALLVVSVLVLGFTIQPGNAQQQIVLKAADAQPEGYPTVEGLRYMGELLSNWTNGRIKIEVYAGGLLGGEKDEIELAQMGALDIIRVSTAPVVEVYPKIAILSLPYLYENSEHMWKVLNSDIGQSILDELKPYGLVGLNYMDAGARSFYTTKREIHSPEDLRGMKIRVQESEIMMDTVRALGGSSIPMAYGEVYTALQTGTIDGAENNPPSYYTSSHYEVAGYYTLDEHQRVPEITMMSLSTWNRLSPEDQRLVKKAAKEAQEKEIELWRSYETECLEKLKDAGVKIIELKPEERKAFEEAVQPVYEKYAMHSNTIADIRAMGEKNG